MFRRPLDRRKEFVSSRSVALLHSPNSTDDNSNSHDLNFDLLEDGEQNGEKYHDQNLQQQQQRLIPSLNVVPYPPLTEGNNYSTYHQQALHTPIHQNSSSPNSATSATYHNNNTRRSILLPYWFSKILKSQLFTSLSLFHHRIQEWLHPIHTPVECQLFRIQNIAVPACYLFVGLLQGLSSPLINVLPLDLGASEAQQTTVSSIRGLPASLKIFFGFMSDTMPIFGYRRKPYMILGWCVSSLSMLCLLYFSNLQVIIPRNAGCFGSSNSTATFHNNQHDDMNHRQIAETVQIDSIQIMGSSMNDTIPSIPFFSLCLLGFGTGFWLSDVMGDSIVAERAKLELPEHRGSIQSTCYACRFFGKMIAAPLSTYIYSSFGPYYVVMMLSILPILILPMVFMFHEKQYTYVSPVRRQCIEIWQTVCSRAVWQPMGFVYLYNIMQVGNSAWKEYLVTVHHFTSCQLNMLLISAYVLLYLGVVAYKYYFIKWSWRTIYVVTTTLNGSLSILQVLLIRGITFGLSPFLFTLGDDAIVEFVTGIQFLPTTIMMVNLCPEGSEGASYAMFTTVNNSAATLSKVLSTQLLTLWDVSKHAFIENRMDGMVNLTTLTTFIQVSAIAFIQLLPRHKDDLNELKAKTNSYSSIGGLMFLFITFGSIAYAITVGLLNIISPGWNGES